MKHHPHCPWGTPTVTLDAARYMHDNPCTCGVDLAEQTLANFVRLFTVPDGNHHCNVLISELRRQAPEVNAYIASAQRVLQG